jgi:putative transcriptional regulator
MPKQNNHMNRIQEILEEKGVSKAELARLLHKSKGTITLYTSNQVQPPIPVLFEIAKILNTDPRKLLDITHQ